jgi:hypothetical protein
MGANREDAFAIMESAENVPIGGSVVIPIELLAHETVSTGFGGLTTLEITQPTLFARADDTFQSIWERELGITYAEGIETGLAQLWEVVTGSPYIHAGDALDAYLAVAQNAVDLYNKIG